MADMESLDDLWRAVCENCIQKKSVTEIGYNVWIKDLKPIELRSGEMVLGIYSEYKKSVIENNYIDVLEDSFLETTGFFAKVKIVVQTKQGVIKPQETAPEKLNAVHEFTFDNFVVGSSNRFAHAASMAVADNPSKMYNPLFIYGNSGVGKTHLVLAIKHHIEKTFPEKKIEYIRCENFTNALIEALGNGTISSFHNRFRSVDVLIMDDIQFIAGKTSTQEEFFNTFEALSQENKQIIITSDRPPKDIKTLEDRLRNRFESGLMADMSPPDFETRVGIINTKAQQHQISIDESVVYYIAEQLKTNTRQLEGVVKKLQAYFNIHNKVPTISVVQGYIRDIVNDSQPEPITVEKIVSEVARTYSVSEEDIFSKRKTAPVAFARQVSMYVVREITQLSYTAIGKSFGKDHTTVLYTIRKMEDILKKNSFDRKIIDDIIKNLKEQ